MNNFSIILQRLRIHSYMFEVWRYAAISCISFTIVLILLCVSILQESWTLITRLSDGLSRHIPQLSAEFLPIPIAFILWVRLMEAEKHFTLSFSPVFCAIAVAALTQAQAMPMSASYYSAMFLIAILAGLFVMLPWMQFWRRVKKNPRIALVLVIAATAAINYYMLMDVLWKNMCLWTTQCVWALLRLYQFNAEVAVHPLTQTTILIRSPSFLILVNRGCNGLEGIFLFNFMLSVMLLLDWEFFKTKSILLLYGLGVVYMFFINVIRITLFFSLGYWAYRPDSWEWIQHLQGAPVYLFHSYVGWVVYLLAFALFALRQYSAIARQKKRDKITQMIS